MNNSLPETCQQKAKLAACPKMFAQTQAVQATELEPRRAASIGQPPSAWTRPKENSMTDGAVPQKAERPQLSGVDGCGAVLCSEKLVNRLFGGPGNKGIYPWPFQGSPPKKMIQTSGMTSSEPQKMILPTKWKTCPWPSTDCRLLGVRHGLRLDDAFQHRQRPGQRLATSRESRDTDPPRPGPTCDGSAHPGVHA